MSKQVTNQRAFSYGIAGVVIANAASRNIIGQLQTTGNLNIAGLTSEVIETRGGIFRIAAIGAARHKHRRIYIDNKRMPTLD